MMIATSNMTEVINYIIDNAPLLVGLILPPIIDVINKEVHGEQERFLVTALIAMTIAVLYKWEALTYGSPDEVFQSFALIFTESQVVYKLYFKDSALRFKLHNKLGLNEPVETVSMPTNETTTIQ